jgi:AraC-like DNA-binding protein
MDPSTVHSLDLALRAGVITLLLLVAALLWRDRAQSLAARLGTFFAIGVAAYVAHSIPGFAAPPRGWQAPLLALSGGNAVVFWIFARALFDDEFRLHWGHAVAWCVLAAAALLNCYLLAPLQAQDRVPLGTALTLATLVFAVLAVGQTLATWRADLVERRRRLRLVIVGGGAGYTVVVTIARLAVQQGSAPALASLADAAGLAAIVLLIVWRLVHVPRSSLFKEEVRAPSLPVERADASPPPADAGAEPADAADAEALARLERLMTLNRIYRQENLSIGVLAAEVKVPEYKLRRLINQRLGHRNFNVFLNGYRLAEARQLLADPAQAELPVLTIAMDVGFQSIGPFNRAFKTGTGVTPSEFRRLGGRVPSPPAALALADSEIG